MARARKNFRASRCALEESIRGLGRKGLHEAVIGVRQVEDHKMRRPLYDRNDPCSNAEVVLRDVARVYTPGGVLERGPMPLGTVRVLNSA